MRMQSSQVFQYPTSFHKESCFSAFQEVTVYIVTKNRLNLTKELIDMATLIIVITIAVKRNWRDGIKA